jgi:hypothetical protein
MMYAHDVTLPYSLTNPLRIIGYEDCGMDERPGRKPNKLGEYGPKLSEPLEYRAKMLMKVVG